MTDLLTTQPPENGRGCGIRDEEMPYLSSGLSPFGMPLEHFIFDPTPEWLDVVKRGYTLIVDQEGITHVGMFFSKGDYPHWWDFVMETKHYGVSRKVGKEFPFHRLTPDKSKFFFIHPRGIPTFDYTALGPSWMKDPKCCRLHYCKWLPSKEMEARYPHLSGSAIPFWQETNTPTGFHPDYEIEPCAFASAQIAYLVHRSKKAKGYEVEELDDCFTVRGPSFSYSDKIPVVEQGTKLAFRPGVFMWQKITHIEYFQKADPKSQAAAEGAGFDTVTLPW